VTPVPAWPKFWASLPLLPESVRDHPSVIPSAIANRIQVLDDLGWSKAEIGRRLGGVETADAPGATALTRLANLRQMNPPSPSRCGAGAATSELACVRTTRTAARAQTVRCPHRCPDGLIGLGGAEFRLPVLTGVLGYRLRQAIAVNLAISLITVLPAAGVRGSTLAWQPVLELVPVAAAMTTCAVLAAYAGVGLVHRLPETGLRQLILVPLVAIGLPRHGQTFPTTTRRIDRNASPTNRWTPDTANQV
jgi:hypothetical protein